MNIPIDIDILLKTKEIMVTCALEGYGGGIGGINEAVANWSK